jgi:hypothetical protein
MPESVKAAHPADIRRALDVVFEGEDWPSWEPETLLASLKDRKPDDTDKILAVQAVARNPALAFTSAAAFEKVVNAFCNNTCVMDVSQPPHVEEMAYAVGQLISMCPDKKFSGEVPGYVAATARYRGWFALPSVLSFGQTLLNGLTGSAPEQRVLDLYASMDADQARALLNDEAVAELGKNGPGSSVARDLIGALLFDPTLPYRT